jgi:hypothetical protein
MKKIELANGKGFALVDDEDYEWLSQYKWSINQKGGYAKRNLTIAERVAGVSSLMHRQILGLKRGDKRQGDHKFGNRLDNRKENLRIVDNQKNSWNQTRKMKGCTSQYKGVSWNAQCKKWQTHIKKNDIREFLGVFTKEKEAAISYDNRARELFGEYAALNFPKINRAAKGRITLKPANKYWGVYYDKRRKKYTARLKVGKKFMSFGSFGREEDAARAYDEAAKKYRGDKARLNFQD